MAQVLMPMATAVWLVDNTGLTFKQIANFCELHELEVQGIADGTVAINMVGQDPTKNGQLTQAEIDRCEGSAVEQLQLDPDAVQALPRSKGPRYTPVSKRGDKPDAIAWLVRHHPEMTDAQIGRLVGTTKPTIQAIRTRTHWNIKNIQANDPVALGLCRQTELDDMVQKAAEKAAKNNPKPVEAEPVAAASAEAPVVEEVTPTEE